MRSELAAVAGAALVAAASAACAQTDVSTTLTPVGEAQIFSGTVTYNRADRYFFVAKQGARLTARLASASPYLLLALVPADADPTDRLADRHYAKELDLRLAADGRHAVAVLFNPHLRFVVQPPPAPYRLELRVE